jgi:hypothetical protein
MDFYPSESEINSTKNGEKGIFYVWNVTATFQEIDPETTLTDEQSRLDCYIPSFLVSIWGFSGQIKSEGPIIIVNQQGLYNNLQVVVNRGHDLLPESSVSATQAFKMAIPYINQYASENNRTVTEIKASFGMYGTSHRLIWWFDAYFSGSLLENPDGYLHPELSHVFGYTVGIWADTGEILSHQEIGIM